MTHDIDPSSRAPVCGRLLFTGDQNGIETDCGGCLAWRKHPHRTEHHVNTGPEHMPLGLAEHKAHLARLAARGQRDES